MSNEQEQQLARVSDRISEHILAFYQGVVATGSGEFHAEDLRRYVLDHTPVAPASPDRILRDMRRKGQLNYRVVNRAKSIYQALPVTQ